MASSGSLGKLNVEEFMSLTSSEEEDEGEHHHATKYSKRSSHSIIIDSLHDSQSESEEEDGVGLVEPRPLEITSWKDKDILTSESEEMQSPESDNEEERKEGDKAEGEVTGKSVTLRMVKKWGGSLEKTHSLYTFRLLCGSFHAAIVDLLPNEESCTTNTFIVSESAVFNSIVISCFRYVPQCLQHHISGTSSSSKPHLPSSESVWPRVRRTVKQYLLDLLSLFQVLQDVAMQCVVLKHMQVMVTYFVCFPKLVKSLNRSLIERWATGDSHVQVLAFLSLRRLVLLQTHPALHTLLKKMYLSFVRNCKFTNAANLPTIKFMSNSLSELLTVDPPTSYQHGFVYIRQLAIHLRTALTSGKREAQQAVYNWQFIHCLNLWGHVLSQVSHPSLHPLIYPLVQIILGTLQLQPSAKYHPLRLHLIKLLLQLSSRTATYIPIAPYLLEVLEVHGVDADHLESGKPPDLTILLRATKQQLATRSFQAALINEAFELLLQYLSDNAHCIGFPELVHPTLVRLRKLVKRTPYSWLRAQLKQLVEKTEEVSTEITKQRATVTFSPMHSDLITSWESQRKGKDNAIQSLLTTWNKVNMKF